MYRNSSVRVGHNMTGLGQDGPDRADQQQLSSALPK